MGKLMLIADTSPEVVTCKSDLSPNCIPNEIINEGYANGSDEGTTTSPASCTMHADMGHAKKCPCTFMVAITYVITSSKIRRHFLVETTADDDLPFRSISPFSIFLP